MTATVRAILKTRFQQLSNAELDDDVFDSYFEHKMAEKEVDQDNPEVIKTLRAFLDFDDYRSSLRLESLTAFAEGRRDLAADIMKINFEDAFDEILHKHNVDLDDREVYKALQALSDIDNRMNELASDHVREVGKAFKLYAAFQPRPPKSPSRGGT